MKANPILNHSAAHLLAMSVVKLYPNTKLAIGPAIDEGFYYDFLFETPITEADLKAIAKQMSKYQAAALPFEKEKITKKQALEIFKNQPFKLDLINEIHEDILIYKNKNDFLDLCSGPHLENTNKLKFFALIGLSGSYWRGDAKNQMLTRIYGTAWETKEELDKYLNLIEERKQRDHRKIGKDLNIFTFDLLAGQGMPIWLPSGMVLKNSIMKYLDKKEIEYGFNAISTPVLGNKKLYEISGHWGHYKKNMFPLMDVDGEELILRPMTCPHHCLVYKHEMRSYKSLPVRFCENAILHRYESSGSLTGLERVRAMELTDGHVFCTPEQIEKEIENAYKLIKSVHNDLKIEIAYISLSLRDPNDKEKYFDNDEMWNKAESSLRNICKKLHIEVKEMIGEAAFYGPKIDMQAFTALGHEITISTLQLDFLLPERFDLEYKGADGSMYRPVLIHRGLIGTYERFIATLLEQTKGILPLWLSPIQVSLIPVNNEIHEEYANLIRDLLFKEGIRIDLDNRDERLAKKIRDSQIKKIPYQLVIGDEEKNSGAQMNITYREYGKTESTTVSLKKFISIIQERLVDKF